MQSQKIINLLDDNDIELQKFATKIWYIISDQTSGGGNNPYGNGTGDQAIKFDTKVIKSNLCDYPDAYILVTGNIENKSADVAAAGDNPVVPSNVAFKNCTPFCTCNVNIND